MIVTRLFSTPFMVFATGVLLFMGGCSRNRKNQKIVDLQELHTSAMQLMRAKKFAKAADAFDEVESQHPHSDLAAQSQLMAGYCAFKAKRYMRTVDTMDLFMDMHPTSPWMKHACYLRALVYYTSMRGLKKDPQQAQLALEAFNGFLERFPQGEYTKDAVSKRNFLKEHLASHDMLVARYYLGKNNYVAAWRHYVGMLEDWPNSQLIPEVLYRIIECHKAVGLASQATTTLQLLVNRAPKSAWTARAQALLAATEPSNVTKESVKRSPAQTIVRDGAPAAAKPLSSASSPSQAPSLSLLPSPSSHPMVQP